MRNVLFQAVLMCVIAVPAWAQVRVRDFGFGAAMLMHGSAPAAAQVSGTVTAGVRGHTLELAGGAGAGDEFLSLSKVWYLGVLSAGAGPALHASAAGRQPALAGRIALDLPIAPRNAAALRIMTRMIAVNGGPRWSVGAGINLAPFAGGMRLGEDLSAPLAPADAARSWESVVAQLMLLDDGSTCLEDVMATQTAISVRFAPAGQQAVMLEVSRVARILSAGIDVDQLVISAPEPSWVRAAATAGGFPAERIVGHVNDGVLTIQATRAPGAQTIRSARR